MALCNRLRMDTIPKIFGSAVVLIVLLGVFVGFNQKQARDLNSKQIPFLSEVLREKTLCPQNKGCFQELIFNISGKEIRLYSRKKPFYQIGDKVQLIKIYKPPLGPPVCGKAANCSGVDLRETYTLYTKTN